MTMLDTLFGLIPAGSRGQQWAADELQLVNWGGYDGAHRVKFSPEATLLCGGSGSGKSTLMDAYIALMMPHTTPFNGASNGGVTGRPRGEDQRNILSYGRGKLDETRTEEGTHVRVLRGDGVDTWTAIAMTWLDHDGSRFTAVRAWYIPASARVLEDTVKVRATVEGPFSLADLEGAAAHRLSDAAVKSAGLDTYATDREFSAKLHSVLGIGAAGAGSKAMSLLARIQAGQQITTVDELYKRMVLEEPETLALADAVVAHFDELEATRVRMVMAQKQVRALSPIRTARERTEEFADRLRLITEVGQFTDPESLATVWSSGRRLELLREVETTLQHTKRAAETEARSQQALAAAAESERQALEEVLRSSGGERLERAERDLRQVEQKLVTVRENRERFEQALAVLGEEVTDADSFAALSARAHAALNNPNAKQQVREAYAEARASLTELRRQLSAVEVERVDVKRRENNIPGALHESRDMLARAAGLSVADLPFVGELIEVRTEFEPWREAFNVALGGFATTLLIDNDHLDRFRSAINDVRTPMRLRYEGVQTGLARNKRLDPRTLPGRLDFRESVFSGALEDRLDRQYGFMCVDSAAELSSYPIALTITGQVSQGKRGSHGGTGRQNALGFSSARRLGELGEQVAGFEASIAAAEEMSRQASEALDQIDAFHAAYARINDLTWDQVDVAAVELEEQSWRERIADLVDGNPKIAEMQDEISALKLRAAELQEQTGRAKGDLERAALRWEQIVDEVDDAQRVVDDAEAAGRELSPEQLAYLAERFDPSATITAESPQAALAQFDAVRDTAAKLLRDDFETAQDGLEEQRISLRRTLENFLELWPNPNLRADPDASLKDFERMLDDLEESGLHELEGEWKQSLIKLSGNDLTNLDSALGRALREIRERIEPINRIMVNLPFYDDEHRLQITPRENQSEPRRKFRKELRDVRELIAAAETDAEREHAYERMARLMGRIRRTSPDFAELIDVRNHVRVSAEKVLASTKEHVSLYDHIGEKSGGESQELIAFIVGAALRYQLGDADAEKPRYAPVFLDEALIKADAHFTKRAIGAWRGLGFQLIIGAPNDKYSAIEPHVNVEYDILKDTSGRSWAKPKVALPAA